MSGLEFFDFGWVMYVYGSLLGFFVSVLLDWVW